MPPRLMQRNPAASSEPAARAAVTFVAAPVGETWPYDCCWGVGRRSPNNDRAAYHPQLEDEEFAWRRFPRVKCCAWA